MHIYRYAHALVYTDMHTYAHTHTWIHACAYVYVFVHISTDTCAQSIFFVDPTRPLKLNQDGFDAKLLEDKKVGFDLFHCWVQPSTMVRFVDT